MRRGVDMAGFENDDNVVVRRLSHSELTESQRRQIERYWLVLCKRCGKERPVRGTHLRHTKCGPCRECSLRIVHEAKRQREANRPKVRRYKGTLPRVADAMQESLLLLPKIEAAIRNGDAGLAYTLVTKLAYRMNKAKST